MSLQPLISPATVAMLAAHIFAAMSPEDKLDIIERGSWVSPTAKRSMESVAFERIAKIAWNLAEAVQEEGQLRNAERINKKFEAKK